MVPENSPLIVRAIEYGGEDHPATSKRVVVVAVDELPLTDKDSVHKFKILAGPRWSLKPPTNSGVGDLTPWGNGFVKISCEDFLYPAQNLKWISDTLDRLIREANVRLLLFICRLNLIPGSLYRIRRIHSRIFLRMFVTCML